MKALVLAAVLVGSSPAPPLKCGGLPNTFPGYAADAPVVVVDGRVLPGEEGLEGIRGLDVGSVDVTCWNPATGEIGVPPGIAVVRVITRAENRDVVSPTLAAIRAQAEAYERTARYLDDVDRLGLEGTEGLALRLESGGSAWSLVVESRFQRCRVSSAWTGEITHGALQNEACAMRTEEQSRALRQAHGPAPAEPMEVDLPREPADLRHLGPWSELGVYSAVLLAVRDRSPTSRLVLDPVRRAVPADAPWLESISPDGGLAESFGVSNREQTEVLPSDAERLEIDLFQPARLPESDGAGPGDFWAGVRKGYGPWTSIVRLSRPGFSTDGTKAVVYYGWGCGPRCGSRRLAILSRDAGRWTIVTDELMLIF